MPRRVVRHAALAALTLLLWVGSTGIAAAAAIPIGYISWDLILPGSDGRFDIVNLTGPNASVLPDTTFPVSTSVSLTGLSLLVDFSDGSSTTFGSSYFTLGADGISFDGAAIPVGGANPKPLDATLTGTFSPLTLTLTDGSTVTILPTFSATIGPSVGTRLSDGDLGVIFATTGDVSPVPEPGTIVLFGTGIVGLLSRKRERLQALLAAGRRCLPGFMLLGVLLIPGTSWAANVNLNTWTSPDNGVAGVNNVNITASGFAAGTITPANVVVTFSTTCGGPALATAAANSVKTVLGSTKRVNVSIPGTLASGTYFVAMTDSTLGDVIFGSNDCSQINVTHTSATLSACVPTSSLGINAPVNPGPVTAIVPRGAWSGGTTGIRVVTLEGVGPTASIATGSTVNSCAANPATGQSVCVANDSNVYLLNASGALTNTLVSGSNTTTGFSGGSCRNCGVAINALTNQAVIAMGFTPSPSNSAMQVLDLNTNTFSPPKAQAREVSEDISIDPTRGYILSPNENNVYNIVQFNSTTGVLGGEFGMPTSVAGEFDSAAEDCSTGIALAAQEFSSNVFITDLTQATFVAGTPGSWTAPSQSVLLAGTSFSAGTSGITVAPGSSHLAIVTGEFGGSSFAVLQLPSTSGTGTPNFVDYAFVSGICTVNAGLDPHTISAYTSPNDGKAYGVMASGGPPPDKLAILDMAAVLAAPRTAGTHTVAGGAICTGPLVRFVPVP